MKTVKRGLVLFTSFAIVGCSGLEGMRGFGIPGTDISRSVGNVDIGQAIKAGTDLAKAVNVEDKDIQHYAKLTAKHEDSKAKIAPAGSKYSQRLRRLVAKHGREDGLNLNYKVYLSPELNAFSTADGSIRIFSGLMDRCSDEELLSVIGHEIGHIKEGHSADRVRTALTARAARNAVGSMNNIGGLVADSAIGGFAEEIIKAQFSQDNEESADVYGVKFMRRHHYKPQAAVSMLNKLAIAEEKQGADPAEFRLLASHPAPRRRAEKVQTLLADMGETPAVMTTAAHSSEPKVAANREVQSASAEIDNEPQYASLKPAAPTLSNTTRVTDGGSFGGSLERGIYIQITAENIEAAAKAKREQVRKFGEAARIQQATVHGEIYYRVLVGPFTSSAVAADVRSRLQAETIAEEDAFIRTIQ